VQLFLNPEFSPPSGGWLRSGQGALLPKKKYLQGDGCVAAKGLCTFAPFLLPLHAENLSDYGKQYDS
jgi:hypothetical protein